MAKITKMEDILKRLEELNRLLADEELSLDEAVKLYAEGAELVAVGSKRLESSRLKLEEISLKMTDVFVGEKEDE